MKQLAKIFKLMDQQIFKAVDTLRAQSFWQQISESFRLLSDGQQKVVNYIASIGVVLLPIIVLVVLSLVSSSYHREVNEKEQLINTLNTIGSLKSEYKNLERAKLSNRFSLTTEADAQNAMTTLLDEKNIKAEKISISDFARINNKTGFVVATFKLSFKNFSLEDLTGALTLIAEREKAVITNISIAKNELNGSLSGTLGIVHYGKGN